MTIQFPVPPTYADPVIFDQIMGTQKFNPVWLRWFLDLAQLLTAAGGGGIVGFDHNSLSNIQGGAANDYYHVTGTEHSELVNAKSANIVYAGPASGSPAVPAFRALVTADLPAGTGTVTSVALAVTQTGIFDVTGSPITTSGTITLSLDSQVANTFLAGPTSGANAVPTFRTITTADLPVGTGTVTSIAPGGGLTSTLTATAPGSAITSAGTLSGAELVNSQTGTSYTIVDGDRAKLVTLSNASPVAVSLPQAGASSQFQAGWFCDIENSGPLPALITPTTSTIDGATSFSLGVNQGVRIASNGTNYLTQRGGSGGREVLAASRTYYVRSDGNDANTCLANNSGGAFLTIQKAVNVAASLDISIYNVTIQIGVTGTYVGAILKAPVGAGTLVIVGNAASPSGYVITKAVGSSVIFDGESAIGNFQVTGVRPHDATASRHFKAGRGGCVIYVSSIDFGDVTNYMLHAANGGQFTFGGTNYLSCTTTFTSFAISDACSVIQIPAVTSLTWLANSTVSLAFIYARRLGYMLWFNITHTLGAFTATGKRYYSEDNADIVTGGAGPNYVPGTIAGSTATGGLYS